MALSCSYIPRNKKGEELKGFSTYRKELGYNVASKVFTVVLAPSFQDKYKSKLTLDEQGVPTYESALTVPLVRKAIGIIRLSQSEQKKFSYIPNTRENYNVLLQSALSYNTSSDMRDLLTAVVTPSDDDTQLRVEIREKTAGNDTAFQNQYGAARLNERLVELFGNLGVTVDLLEENENVNGYVDFSKAQGIADGFNGLINIADNMEGEQALSEEFAHLLIGMFRDEPLVQRSLRQLENNEELLKEALGDEYQNNVDYYTQNPNYDDDGNQVSLNQTLAEEALGKILQEKLKNQTTPTKENNTLDRLINRLVSFIKKIFKGRDVNEVIKAKNEVNVNMGELAKQILSSEKEMKAEQVVNANRDSRFYQVKEKVDKVIELLEHADEIERKRTKISPKEEVQDTKKRVLKLESLINDKDKMVGVHTYAKWALSDLNEAMNKLTISDTLETEDFKSLRHIKAVLDSYAGFIREFHDVLDELGDGAIIEVNGEEVNLRDLWRDINDLYESCTTSFKKQALASFSDYLAPIYEKSPLRDKNGNLKPLEEVLIGEDFDISEFDRWCTSMGNSSSVILQMFDMAVKQAKDKARLRTMSSIRDIWKIRDNAEKRGITEFEWMFEKDNEGHKTGNYIQEYNTGQYKKDLAAFEEKLAAKYGKNPIGDDYRQAEKERAAWHSEHSARDIFDGYRPNESYRNPAYKKLTKAQQDTLNEILVYKNGLELLIPKDRRDTNRAIQRRRDGSQRLIDAATNPSQAFQSLKEAVKDSFNRNEDDDQLYGDRTRGLTDFTGKEYLTLPVLYTNRLKNPDELSTDVIGDLMLYAYMANNYDEISQTYDPLEIGVSVVAEKNFVKNSGSKLKEEVLNTMGRVTRKSIKTGSNTAFAKKLRDFLECQVYGIYLKDEGEILGKDVQKTVSTFQKLTSMAYLGCNYLAGIANVATAAGMQNIEAAAREFFGPKELAKADGEYWFKLMPGFMAELTDRKKQSELALFDELFDVRQNAKDKLHNVQKKNLIQRFFGQNWLFIQQGLGDHWIYNRTAIAMAMRKKIKVNGKEMSVWDAREIYTDSNGYKMMRIKPGAKNLDGSDFSATDFARQIAHVNHVIAGIYNDEDQNAANRTMVGKLALQMRKWIIPQFMRRFQSNRANITMEGEEEGYYRTFGRVFPQLAKDIWQSGFKIAASWDKLSKTEKANVSRAITEMAQFWSLYMLVTFLGTGNDDPDRTWATKFAEYMANREVHELGFLTPGPTMFTEGYKTITSPFVTLSAANKVAQAIVAAATPANWFPDDEDLIKSGAYKGHSHLYKRFVELPIAPFTQWKQIEKLSFEGLKESVKYYGQDYR